MKNDTVETFQEGGGYLPTPSMAKSVVDGIQSGNYLLKCRPISWIVTPTFLDQTAKGPYFLKIGSKLSTFSKVVSCSDNNKIKTNMHYEVCTSTPHPTCIVVRKTSGENGSYL